MHRDAEKDQTVVILRCGTKPVGPISARDFYDSTVSMVSSYDTQNDSKQKGLLAIYNTVH